MVEAQDIESVTQADLLRTNVVTGLQQSYKSAFGAELIRMLEDDQGQQKTFEVIRAKFQAILSRIRSLAALLLPEGLASNTGKQEDLVAAYQAEGHQQAGGRMSTQQNPPHHAKGKRDTRVCHYCNEMGHIRRNCPRWKEWLSAREQNARQNVQQQGSRYPGGHQLNQPQAYNAAGDLQRFGVQAGSHGQHYADTVLQQISKLLHDRSSAPPVPPDFHAPGNARMYCTQAVASSVRKEHSAEYLWLDGGSTHHIVSSKDMLYDHTGSHVTSVLVAGGEKHEVICEGKLWLDTNNGPVILCGVLLVPSFAVNLCSEGRLADKGLYIVKTATTASVRDNQTQDEIISGTRQDDLYKLDCTIRRPGQSSALAATADVLPDVALFHRRLGHPSIKATKKLLFSNAVIGVDQTASMQQALPTSTCLVCKKGKAKRASFPQSTYRASAPCALIHSDLMGPFTDASMGGALYVVTFLDDFSGYGEAVPIKGKTDVYDELREVFSRWQRQSGYQVKRLRSDRGTEYKGQIAAYLRSEGIVHETSTAYTPEQNGRAERFNRTILERVRCMLAEFELPTILWGEAVVYAAYCRNYMPMQGQMQSPIELMFSVKPSVSHLRVFGCQAVRTIPRHQRGKADCPGEVCVFVGCAANSKAWRLLRMNGTDRWESSMMFTVRSTKM
jgi:transposase InsO family protein